MKIIYRASLFTAAFFLSFLITGCSLFTTVYYEKPVEFRNPQKMTEFIESYQKYISGKTIFLDPGHGGEDRANRGPDGKAIEADVNLRVGLFLREYLRSAGVNVIMSREVDATVSLNKRSEMANTSGADIFISIHHNAPGSNSDTWINYTSTYYHAKETDFEYEPMEQDLARFIQRDLAYAMRQSGGLGSFDGTYSDYNIYPGKGFAVLRNTTIPAVLIEGSFFTNPTEEQRLSVEEYNKIQAWGIFRGICRYFKSGAPKIVFSGEKKINLSETELSFLIQDSIAINLSSIEVYVDSVKTEDFSFNKKNQNLKLNVKNDKPAYVRIKAANINKNYSLPFHFNYPTNK